MARNHLLFTATSALALVFTAAAQQPAAKPAPNLKDILNRLTQDASEYQAFVPSFFCDEHVLSQRLKNGKVATVATLDSNFRVVRAKSGALTESQEPKLLNGKATTKDRVKLPIAFNGGFSNAVATFFSSDSRGCFDYKLVDPGTGPLEIDFSIQDHLIPMVAQCSAFAPGTAGKALVDRDTLHALHVNRAHPDVPGRQSANSASVEFTRTLIGDAVFYLPTTVEARSGNGKESYLYRATYSNCHKLAVTTTITAVTDPPK